MDNLKYDSIEINDDSVFEYDDIEIMANEEIQQFIVLIKGFDFEDNLVLYDAVTGFRVSPQELSGYKHYDKAKVLHLDSKVYTGKYLHELSDFLNTQKVNFSFKR